MRHFAILALLAMLTGCAGITSTEQTSPALAKIQVARAYVDATLVRIKADVATLKAQLPAKVAAIEAKAEPVLAALEKLAGTYDAAVIAKDISAAESLWATVRTAVTSTMGVLALLGV